jgi:hypothetical protein
MTKRLKLKARLDPDVLRGLYRALGMSDEAIQRVLQTDIPPRGTVARNR